MKGLNFEWHDRERHLQKRKLADAMMEKKSVILITLRIKSTVMAIKWILRHQNWTLNGYSLCSHNVSHTLS